MSSKKNERVIWIFIFAVAVALGKPLPTLQAAEPEPLAQEPASGAEASETTEVEVLPEMEVIGTSATKTELPVFDTPFSLQTVPQEVIQDQNVIELKDATRNVSGVVSGNESGGSNDNFFIRGFDLKGVVYRDGTRLQTHRTDPANIERVEVLKGAAASLYGRIEPGGLVNVITKKPLDYPYYSIEQQIAEFDFYRTEADATGPITADKSWLYRAVVSYQNNESFRDFVENEQIFFAPSLTWNLSPSTQFNLSFEYLSFEDTVDYGIPALGGGPAPVPIERYFGVQDGQTESNFYLADFNWSHEFNKGWGIKHKFAYYRRNNDYNDTGPQALREDEGLVDIFASFPYDDDYDTYFTEVDLTGRFETAGMTHNVLLGAEYYRATHEGQFVSVDSESETFFDPLTGEFSDTVVNPNPAIRPISLNNPVYQRVGDLPAINGFNYTAPISFGTREREYWYAVFAQDFIDVTDKLRFVFFGRYDIARNRADSCIGSDIDPVSGAVLPCELDQQEIEDKVFSSRVGISYDIVPWLNVFGNYSQSFGSPGGGTLPDGSPPKYEEGEQGEAGLKAQLFDDRLLTTLTFYHLTNENVGVPVPNRDFTIIEQAGEARSRGIELDMVGHITDNWSVIGSYAYTDARITKDRGVFTEEFEEPVLNELGDPVFDELGDPVTTTTTTTTVTPGRTGKRLRNTPEHAFSLWTKYEWPFGLGLGAGLFGATSREVDGDNTVSVPGFVRVDAAASYSWYIGPSRLTAQLNVFNLLDKEIFSAETSFTNTINVVPVAPRTVLGSLRLEW